MVLFLSVTEILFSFSQFPNPFSFLRTTIALLFSIVVGPINHLKRQGIEPGKGFVVLDDAPGPGGAWQHRWDSLTLNRVNGINDLPGMHFDDATHTENAEVQANEAVPEYYGKYEKAIQMFDEIG